MPSPSPGKFRGPIVRQLSLETPTPLHPRELKKQFSEDDTRVLESVEVTGQGWTRRSASGKNNQGKIQRPKPVKVAWADRKPESSETPAGMTWEGRQKQTQQTERGTVWGDVVVAVEVIATKCQGQPRPTSLKTQRLRSPLLGNKDTLVYTRLQLAERLRNAWSEREKLKPNINIFLARGAESTRSENEPERSGFPDTSSALSDPSAPLDKKRKAMRVRAFSQDFPQQDFLVPEPPSPDESETSKISPRSEGKEFTVRHLQELNKIEIRMTKIEREGEGEGEGQENKPLEGGVKRCRNKTEAVDGKETPPVTAQDRRANFRRSSIMQKTITESFDENENKAVVKQQQKKPQLMRAFSAPSQSDQVEGQKVANVEKKVRVGPQRRLQPTVSFDIPDRNTDEITALRERIKSAPVRRKLKSAAARRKNKDRDSSDEEKKTKDSTTGTKKTSKRSQQKKGGEIVTMVSLVSPAASDTEDSVINLPMDSWRGEEKSEQTQPIKPSLVTSEESKESFNVPKFVSLRKATKSVTFQSHPVLNRSYSASFPLRRAPAGTPIIVPTPVIHNNPALTPAQLLERDKRTTVFSGLDGRGIKRKLLRSSTESTKEDEDEKKENKDQPTHPQDKDKDDDEEEEEKPNGEPEFKCPKERECWTLYQKMLEKGVSISFDTVLRGMLTPTEYRLRKNQLLSHF